MRFLLFSLFFFLCSLSGYGEQGAVVRFAPKQYHIKSVLQANCSAGLPNTLVLVTAQPVSSRYQDISNFTFSAGKSCILPYDNGKYLYAVFQKRNMRSAPRIIREFDVTVYGLKTDWSKVVPGKVPSGKYAMFTKNAGDYIVPNHPEIIRIHNTISQKSKNLLEYAREAYLYTLRNFRYCNPNTGLHKLSVILKNGGGDCGNLATVFITLLRAKKIPARHVVGLRPGKSSHVWAEFYLDGAGWIPADIALDINSGTPKHFGYINDNCIVMHKDIYFPIHNGKKKTNITFLQNFAFWYWTDKKIGPIKVALDFKNI